MNQQSINFIKKYEGCKLSAYRCPANVWTIGYGHTKKVRAGQKITQAQAEKLLQEDLAVFEQGVNDLSTVELTENQCAALVSFAYNLGLAALKKSTLLKKLNAADFSGAADEFLKWDNVNGKPLKGLTARRGAERTLFLTP